MAKPNDREQLDRYLESKGLLNYQTKGLSQAEIARRYANAGVQIDSNWADQNYGEGFSQQFNNNNNNNGGGSTSNVNAAIPLPSEDPMLVNKTDRYGLNPATQYQYVIENGLTKKYKLPVPVPGAGVTNDVVKAGQGNWVDIFSEDRKSLLTDPKFYSENHITQYSPAQQQQILADPNFDFNKLADWQKPFYKVSSDPRIMASPMAIAGAHAGSGFGLIGKAVGAAGGYALGLIGGQEFNPAGGYKEQPTAAAKGMYLLNELAQWAEQAVGYGTTVGTMLTQSPETRAKNVEWLKDPANREALWKAGINTWEYGMGGELQNLLPMTEGMWERLKADFKDPATVENILKDYEAQGGKRGTWDAFIYISQQLDPKLRFAKPGEGFIVGANDPVKIGGTAKNLLGGESLNTAGMLIENARYIRAEVDKGRDITDVTNEVLAKAGGTVGGQLGDFYMQLKADPLDLIGPATSKIGQTAANLSGNKVAAFAFTGTNGLQEAVSKYRAAVQTPLKNMIDPNFRVDEMGWVARQAAGITSDGKIKAGIFTDAGLLDPVKKANVLQEWTTLDPGARAEIGKSMFHDNLGVILSTFENPKDAIAFIGKVASGDNTAWAEMGDQVANSPEWYTILPALQAYKGTLDGHAAMWDMAAPNRDALLRIADVMRMDAGKLIDDWGRRDTHKQDFARVVEAARNSDSAAARALLNDVADGSFTPETLKDIVDVFSGDGAIPWNPAQWRAGMLGDLSDHFDQWAANRLGLKPDSFAVRTAHLLKSAQSILLLGGSPGYALTNGISNMVHRAATGIYGYLTPAQITSWMDRFGTRPDRMGEGYGMAGDYINQPADKISATDKEIRAAQTETKGALAWMQRAISGIGNKLPFTKLSGKFEQLEGTQGHVIAMRNFWGQTWRRGVGFKQMPAELAGAFRAAGIDPEIIHSAVESGMNYDEITKAIYGREQGMKARALVHEAAQSIGKTSQQAAEILEKAGVLDKLDNYLSGADSLDKINAAFERTKKTARRHMEMAAARDITARADHIAQRITTEGAKGVIDIAMEIEQRGSEKMLQHYERMGNAADKMDDLDPAQRKTAWSMAYSESTAEYRFFNAERAGTYLGMMKGLGLGDNALARQLLATMGDTDTTMDNTYRQMRELRDGHFEKWKDNWDDPQQYAERDTVEYQIDKMWKQSLAREASNLKRMAELFGKQYELLFKSKETGEAARQAYEQIADFRKEMTKRQQDFREQQKQARAAGVPLELRQLKAKEFWGETYRYMIVEMMKIKQDAIGKLDKIARDGIDPTMSEKLQADIAARESEKAGRIAAVWDVAEGYWAKGGNFKRDTLGGGADKHALIKVLSDPAFGGLPDLRGLDDERLSPEFVKFVLENRKKAIAVIDNGQVTIETPKKKAKADENISLLQYIVKMGGLDVAKKGEYARDVKANVMPGLFQTKGEAKGWDITDVARRLAEEGKFAIDLNDPNDLGGVQQTQDLLDRALRGEKIYPVGHDYTANDKAIAKAEAKYLAVQMEDATPPQPSVNADEWRSNLDAADDAAKLDMIAEMPNELDAATKAYASQVWDDVFARQAVKMEQESIALNQTRAEIAMEEAQQAGSVAMTRELLAEKYREAFPNVSDEQIDNWMEMGDAVLTWIGKQDGKTLEQMYELYKDVLRGEAGNLMQDGRIEPINRRLEPEDAQNYARMLARLSEGEVRSAIRNEDSRADRVAILDALHDMNPKLAENVARQVSDYLFQDAWHGSPYKFDKFSLDHLGSGEGVQAYGWGLYFADAKKVAESYRQTLSKIDITYKGKKHNELGNSIPSEITAGDVMRYMEDGKTAVEAIAKVVELYKKYGWETPQKSALELDPNDFSVQRGQLYRVDIPDETYLLWDKPLSEQNITIDNILSGVANSAKDYKTASRWASDDVRGRITAYFNQTDVPASTFYHALENELGSAKAASLALKEAGLSGIKYLDGSSRGKGEGTYNYVIFDDNAIKIIETYYQGNKGGVQFLDGKAIIHAWEGGDITTIVHENAHIFLNMMQEMARRGNVPMLDDLGVFQDWAQLRQNGNVWEAVNGNGRHSIAQLDDGSFEYRNPTGGSREFATFDEAKYVLEHEMFARGFEEYMAEGKAPTKALERVFKNFRNWLYKIYGMITGSAIDVNLTPEMRAFFDKMAGGEKAPPQPSPIEAVGEGAIRGDARADAMEVMPAKYADRLTAEGFTFAYGSMTPNEYNAAAEIISVKYADRLMDAGVRVLQGEGNQLPVSEKVTPIRELGTGANVYFETDNGKYRVNDSQDGVTLNIYGKGDAPHPIENIQFSSADEAVTIAKQLAEYYPGGVPEAVLIGKVVSEWRSNYAIAIKHGVPAIELTKMIDDAIFTKSFDGMRMTDLFPDISWKERIPKERSLMQDLMPIFEKKVGDLTEIDNLYDYINSMSVPAGKVDLSFIDDAITQLDQRTEKIKQSQQYADNLTKVQEGRVESTPRADVVDNRESRLLNALVEKIEAKDWFAKSRDFESFIKNLGYNLDNENELNLAYDVMEGAYNLQARKVRAELDGRGAGLQERIEAMDALESNLTEARRTLGKMKLQQFSTPITISEAAGWVADVRAGDTVGEPTAGTANLVDRFYGRDDITLKVNEIDQGRQIVLSMIGYEPTDLNLMSKDWVIENGKKAGAWADVVISNPPWGAYSTGKYGNAVNTPVKLNDWSQRFTYLTLLRMPEDGRFVGVMPANWLYTLDRKTRAITNKPSEFYKWLKKNYTVQAVIESLPGAYKQRGTDVSSLLVVIDKTTPLFETNTVERYGNSQPKTLADYVQAVESVAKRTQEAVENAQAKLKPIVAGPDASGIVDPGAVAGEYNGRVEHIGEPVEVPGKRAGGGARGDNQLHARPDVRPTVEPDGNIVQSDVAGRGAGSDPGTSVLVDGQPAEVYRENETFTYSDAFRERLDASRAKVKDSGVFTEYLERSPLRLDETSHPHPTIVVESKSLAGVPYPILEENYRPSESVMKAMQNRVLSHGGNIDPIWQAVQMNDKHGMGMLVADDVGMGKSRTAAGFVLDRIEKGKKRIVVVTKGEQNINNLMRNEFPAVYSGMADENGGIVQEGRKFPAEMIFLSGENFPEIKKGNQAIPTFGDKPAVYFVADSQFADFQKALNDVRPDVFVSDEAHVFKNLDSDKGQAWVKLHQQMIADKANFLYLTATPGMDIAELQYLFGLKVWAMGGFEDWIKIITGQESAESVTKKAASAENVQKWADKVQAARDAIKADPKTVKTRNGNFEGYQVGSVEVFKPTAKWQKDEFGFQARDKSVTMRVGSEDEAVIIASMVSAHIDQLPMDFSYSDLREMIQTAQADYGGQYQPPNRSELADLGIREASDILNKKKKWGQKKGISAFSATLPPAHTEQIMRELKVAGSYMSRDITRVGVEFNVQEYKPTAEAKRYYNERVKLYRDIYDAWARYAKMNKGKKNGGAGFGINGDIQADAKRALFNMRLPGIIEEAKAAMARGEQVVISMVSVGEADGEKGNLPSSLNKINTFQVDKLGDGVYSDPMEIPEAIIEIEALRERVREMPLASPVDILREAFGDQIDFITGATTDKGRERARKNFQQNQLPIVVISGAGKTGINLHDVTGKKRVHLIVGDYEWSATIFKQELGRVDRTGQKSSPFVTIMHTGSAGEKKFIATISNRMKGLGATSKGSAESTGTGVMTDAFELGSTIDKMAINAMWQDLSEYEKMLFLDPFFRDKTVPDASRSTLDTNSESIKKFLLGLMSIETDDADRFFQIFLEKRQALIDAGVDDEMASKKTAASTGDILRSADLGDNLRLTEVKAQDGSKFGILDGVLTKHMNTIKQLLSERFRSMENDTNAWMRWVSFYDEAKKQYVTGLQVKPTAVESVADHFGQSMAGQHKPETAMTDLKAGDRIKIVGANVAEWEIYIGKAGARENKIVIDGAKMKDRDALANYTAYSAVGGFFFVPDEKLQDFLKRFPIRENAPKEKPRLYQDAPVTPEADPRMPLGGYEQAAGTVFQSDMATDGWQQEVEPLLNAMQDVALKRFENRRPGGATKDMSPEGTEMLRQYMKSVKQDMAGAKLATMRWGENQRDFAMLNYKRRYGFDKYLEMAVPYQFYYTRSMMNWAMRVLDKPSWLSNYARLQRQMNRYERDIPERLRGKIAISAPFLPDWMGDTLYIDPLKVLFPFTTFTRPFDQMAKDANTQQAEAERVLQEWAADGKYSQNDVVQAAKTRSGATWERALAEAGIRREKEISGPLDFVSTMLGPAWYLTTPAKLLGITNFPGAEGGKESIQPTPMLNTIRAVDNVTQGTWAEPVGNLIGLLGKPEEKLRQVLGLPELDQWGDYYIDRQLANMTAEGLIDPETARMAMIDRSGQAFEQARERVKQELALRVPGASALMAGLTADNFGQGVARLAATAPVSLFGATILPEGELEYRGLKQEWNEAWRMKDMGDEKAITRFFDEHPEYEVYLAKNKKPEERLSSFLVSQIWDGYMALGATDRKMFAANARGFREAFLDEETRSPMDVDAETLTQWAQMLSKKVPETAQPAGTTPAEPMQFYDPAVTQITDQYFEQRSKQFPKYYEQEQGYYNLPKSERTSYLLAHPSLKAYWDWKDKWFKAHPDLVPIFKGQVFKRVDTSAWPPMLEMYVGMYAMTGETLGRGAWKALEQQWILAGRPYGNVQAWLDSEVAPSMMYGGGQ